MSKREILKLKKITNFKWLNLFHVTYRTSRGKVVKWIFSSREEQPLHRLRQIDAVVIVPMIKTPEGNKIVLIKEYRVAIGGCEYGFPAGLLESGDTLCVAAKRELKEETGLDVKEWGEQSNVVYSSPGISDESCVIVFVEATGTISDKYQEPSEDIEVLLYDIGDVKKLLDSDKKVGAKAWGVLYYYSKIGKIE